MAYTGVDDNETMKVFRSGGADPDGNQPGDLYVTIKVTLIFLLNLFQFYIFQSISPLADVTILLFIWGGKRFVKTQFSKEKALTFTWMLF